MGWAVQRVPPSEVAINAAPLGAPPPPTVEPTAQHLEAVTQVTAVTELTGLGGTTGTSAPLHGDPGLNGIVARVADVFPDESAGGPDEHPARTAPVTIAPRIPCFRRRHAPLMLEIGLTDLDDVGADSFVVPGLATLVP